MQFFVVLEKFTCAYLFQTALEIIRLPIQIALHSVQLPLLIKNYCPFSEAPILKTIDITWKIILQKQAWRDKVADIAATILQQKIDAYQGGTVVLIILCLSISSMVTTILVCFCK